MHTCDLVVIGSGPAGQKAAICAAKLGKEVAIVERNFTVGGDCVHQGTIPSKTLREAVMFLSGARQREIYGSAYRVKDRITMEDLHYRTQHVLQQETNIIRNQLMRNDIDILPGTASFIDAHTVHLESQEGTRDLKAENILIAVGSQPLRPDGIDFNDKTVIDSNGLLLLEEIPRSMAVVGAGVVGAEYATIFRTLGVRITLIDGRQRPLDFVDDEIEDALMYHMRDNGITLRYGETVNRVAQTEQQHVRITMQSGKNLTADAVLFAAGRWGATVSLNLEAVGLETDKKGRISVNEHYQTGVENIYAAGDVIGFPSLASTSMEQGRLAACHAFGLSSGTLTETLPYGLYMIPEIAMIGPSEQDLTKQSIPYETGIARFRELARAQIMGGNDGMLKLLFHPETLKLLGVHILGEQATELIHIGQAVMAFDGTIEYLRDAVFNYPTLAEAYKVAALDGFNKVNAESMA